MTSRRTANVLSVVTLVVGLVLAVGLAGVAFLMSWCGMWGEACSSTELQQIRLVALVSIGVYFGVPAAVAAVRREPGWLLAVPIETALIAAVWAAIDWF